MILLASIILSLGTVHYFQGCLDDAVQLLHMVSRQDIQGWLSWHAWGCNGLISWLYPFFGRELDLYRLVFMSINVTGYGLLGYIVRRSPLAVMGLASLLWMPETYCSFRELRYDGMMILVLALNLWMISD